jgi:hypothetical protein
MWYCSCMRSWWRTVFLFLGRRRGRISAGEREARDGRVEEEEEEEEEAEEEEKEGGWWEDEGSSESSPSSEGSLAGRWEEILWGRAGWDEIRLAIESVLGRLADAGSGRSLLRLAPGVGELAREAGGEGGRVDGRGSARPWRICGGQRGQTDRCRADGEENGGTSRLRSSCCLDHLERDEQGTETGMEVDGRTRHTVWAVWTTTGQEECRTGGRGPWLAVVVAGEDRLHGQHNNTDVNSAEAEMATPSAPCHACHIFVTRHIPSLHRSPRLPTLPLRRFSSVHCSLFLLSSEPVYQISQSTVWRCFPPPAIQHPSQGRILLCHSHPDHQAPRPTDINLRPGHLLSSPGSPNPPSAPALLSQPLTHVHPRRLSG